MGMHWGLLLATGLVCLKVCDIYEADLLQSKNTEAIQQKRRKLFITDCANAREQLSRWDARQEVLSARLMRIRIPIISIPPMEIWSSQRVGLSNDEAMQGPVRSSRGGSCLEDRREASRGCENADYQHSVWSKPLCRGGAALRTASWEGRIQRSGLQKFADTEVDRVIVENWRSMCLAQT